MFQEESAAARSWGKASWGRLGLFGLLSLALLAGLLFALRLSPREAVSPAPAGAVPLPVELVPASPPPPATLLPPPPETPLPQTTPPRRETPPAPLPPPPPPPALLPLPPPPLPPHAPFPLPPPPPPAPATPPPQEIVPVPPPAPSEESVSPEAEVSPDTPYDASQVDRLPVPQGGISARFPARARRQGVSGQAVVEFVVSPQGIPEQIRVVSASPPGYFEEAAREAVEGCRFQPAWRGGRAVPCRLRLPLEFRLE